MLARNDVNDPQRKWTVHRSNRDEVDFRSGGERSWSLSRHIASQFEHWWRWVARYDDDNITTAEVTFPS